MTFEDTGLSESSLADAGQAGMRTLADLSIGGRARVVRVGAADPGSPVEMDPLALRLLEMGFEEGSEVELAHTGFLGGDPLAFKVHGTLVALRRREAATVIVEPLDT